MMIACQSRRLNAFTEATAGSALALEGAIHPVGDPNKIWLTVL